VTLAAESLEFARATPVKVPALSTKMRAEVVADEAATPASVTTVAF
jgi:hypothetical protein